MPIYEYRPATDASCDDCTDGFECRQSMTDEPLERCPRCGAAVERAISAFQVGKGNILSSSNLADHGFTRLQRKDKGVYEKG